MCHAVNFCVASLKPYVLRAVLRTVSVATYRAQLSLCRQVFLFSKCEKFALRYKTHWPLAHVGTLDRLIPRLGPFSLWSVGLTSERTGRWPVRVELSRRAVALLQLHLGSGFRNYGSQLFIKADTLELS